MKNYEKYADEIRECNSHNFCDDFIRPYILKSDNCNGLGCTHCHTLQAIWLLKDYEESEEPKEPEVDWSKVEVDTPILVRNSEDGEWLGRYFATYENGAVYAWDSGFTSWSTYGPKDISRWKYAKLAKNREEKR